MNNRIFKVLALLIAFALALGVGALVGGGVVYALMQMGDRIPMVKAQVIDPEYGIVIASVVPEGPAAEAGVVRGDILLEIDGEAVEHPDDLIRALEGLEPGDEVKLTVLHGDDQRTLTATLGKRGDQPYLGLVPCGGLPEPVSVHIGALGALIVEVTPGSPAEVAGLQKGDVILAVDGQELNAENDLADLIADYEPGDTVMLEVERPGEEPCEITVELGQHPEEEGAAYLGVQYAPFPQLGILGEKHLPFEEFEFDERSFVFPDDESRQGAIVRNVHEDSPASAAGLEEGDVITAVDGEPVESSQALSDAIAEREPGDEIVLTVYRPGDEDEREIEVTLGEHPDQEGKAYLGVSIGGFLRTKRFFEGEEQPPGFKFFGPPQDEQPQPDSEPWRFEFNWPPGDPDNEWPEHFGDSI